MGVKARKIALMEKLLRVREESLLQKVEDLLDEELIVAYTVEGDPLTVQGLEKKLEAAEEDVKSGRVYTSGEVRNRFSL